MNFNEKFSLLGVILLTNTIILMGISGYNLSLWYAIVNGVVILWFAFMFLFGGDKEVEKCGK